MPKLFTTRKPFNALAYLALSWLCLSASAVVAQQKPALPPTVERNAKLRVVHEAKLFFEGPAWDAATASLYFTVFEDKVTEIRRLDEQGKVTTWMRDTAGINGMRLSRNGRLLAVLRSLYELGLRGVQLPAHNWANEFADSCCAPKKWNGLNEHGRALIREMNRLGMVINISHASDETIAQALEVSRDPLVATHHGLRSLNNIPRTMPDDLLRKLAAKGGVIGFHIGNEFHNRKM